MNFTCQMFNGQKFHYTARDQSRQELLLGLYPNLFYYTQHILKDILFNIKFRDRWIYYSKYIHKIKFKVSRNKLQIKQL